jgi:hypothetical protein
MLFDMPTTKEAPMPDESYVSVKVPKDIYDPVALLARKEERSVSAEIRRILKRHLATREGELPHAA